MPHWLGRHRKHIKLRRFLSKKLAAELTTLDELYRVAALVEIRQGPTSPRYRAHVRLLQKHQRRVRSIVLLINVCLAFKVGRRPETIVQGIFWACTVFAREEVRSSEADIAAGINAEVETCSDSEEQMVEMS